MGTARISLRKVTTTAIHKSPHAHREGGMTLIEIMIVLTLVAAASTLLLSRINNRNNQLKDTIRQIGILSRDIRYRAKLKNVTYRLVIDMHTGESSQVPHQYWVEKSSGPTLLSEGSRHTSYEDKGDKEQEGDKEAPRSNFEVDRSLTPKKKPLVGGLVFEDVEIASLSEKLTDGVAYIHYFPQGLVDESAIHIKYSEKLRWTLAIHPLTGKAEAVSKYISLKEILDR